MDETDMGIDNGFQIIFEGPENDEPSTIRKLKAVFVADLDLSVEQVSSILNSPPSVITVSTSQEELENIVKKLDAAGAKVSVSQVGETVESSKEEISTEETPEDETCFEFELDLDESDEERGEQKVYDLSAPDAHIGTELDAELVDEETVNEVDNLLDQLQETSFVAKEEGKPGSSLAELAEREARLAKGFKKVDEQNSEQVNEKTPETNEAASSKAEKDSTEEESQDIDENSKETDIEEIAEEKAITKESKAGKKPGVNKRLGDVQTTKHTNKSDNKESSEDEHLDKNDEEISTEEDRLVRAGRTRRKAKEADRLKETVRILTGTLIAMLLSLVLLLVGYWYMAPLKDGGGGANYDDMVKSLSSTKDFTAAKKEEPKQEKTTIDKLKDKTTFTLSGKNKFPEKEINSSFLFKKGKLSSIFITVTTVAPEPLTPEKIVRNVPQVPWMYLIKLDKMEVFQKDDGSFLAEGAAKVSIDHLNQRKRVAAPASIRGTFDLNKFELKAHLRITRDITQAPSETLTHIERSDDGFYQVFLSGGILANTVDHPEEFELKPKEIVSTPPRL